MGSKRKGSEVLCAGSDRVAYLPAALSAEFSACSRAKFGMADCIIAFIGLGFTPARERIDVDMSVPRGSDLESRVSNRGQQSFFVEVGGQAVPVASGEFDIRYLPAGPGLSFPSPP